MNFKASLFLPLGIQILETVWEFKLRQIYFHQLTPFKQQPTAPWTTWSATAALILSPRFRLCHFTLYDVSLINNRAGQRRAPSNKDKNTGPLPQMTP